MITTSKTCIQKVSNKDERKRLEELYAGHVEDGVPEGYEAQMAAVKSYHESLLSDLQDIRDLAGIKGPIKTTLFNPEQIEKKYEQQVPLKSVSRGPIQTVAIKDLDLDADGMATARATFLHQTGYRHKNTEPIAVEQRGDKLHVLDGYHRVVQAQRDGETDIKVQVVTDTPLKSVPGQPPTSFIGPNSTLEELKAAEVDAKAKLEEHLKKPAYYQATVGNAVEMRLKRIQRLIAEKEQGPLKSPAHHGTPHVFKAETLIEHPGGKREFIEGDVDQLPEVPEGVRVVKEFPHGRLRAASIGSGEGHQAFGHGLYFASNEKIADWYREQLSPHDRVQYDGQDIPHMVPHDDPVGGARFRVSSNLIQMSPEDALADAIRVTEQHRDYAADWLKEGPPNPAMEAQYDYETKALAELHGLDLSKFSRKKGGARYSVDLKPSEDEYLDWDKPLSQQSPLVKKVLAERFPPVKDADIEFGQAKDGVTAISLKGKPYGRILEKGSDQGTLYVANTVHSPPIDHRSLQSAVDSVRAGIMRRADPTGAEIYTKLAQDAIGDMRYGRRSQEFASNWLLGRGIRGNRYLDADSRHGNAGTSNYVIFNDRDVKITDVLKKARTPEDAALQRDLQHAPIGEVLDGADGMQFMPDGTLYVDLHSAEFIRSLMSALNKDPDEAAMDGVTFHPSYIRRLVALGRDKIVPFLEKQGATETQIENANGVLDMLEHVAGEKGDDHFYAWSFEDVRGHEATHVEDRNLGGTSEAAKVILRQNPLSRNAGTRFARVNGHHTEANQISEMVAELANGGAERMGLTGLFDTPEEFEAAKKAYLDTWANGVVDNNTARIMEMGASAFAETYPITSTLAFEASQRNTGESNAETNQIEENAGEADQAEAGPSAVPSASSGAADEGSQTAAETAEAGPKASDGEVPDHPERELTEDEAIAELTGRTTEQVQSANRKFARTLADNLMDVGDVPYEPQTVEGWRAGAEKILADKGIDGALDEYRKMPAGESEGRKTALGVQIAVEMYADGRYGDLQTFGHELTSNIGNAAQELRAAALMARLSPAFAQVTGNKVVMRAKGRGMTPEEQAKTDDLATKLQQVADNHAFNQAALDEARATNEQLKQNVADLEKALAQASKVGNADLQTALDKANAAIKEYEARLAGAAYKVKGPKALKELRVKIENQRPDLVAAIRSAFPGSPLKMVTSPDTGAKYAEDEQEAHEDYSDALADAYGRVWSDFEDSEPGERQEWPQIKRNMLVKVWNDFITDGKVKDIDAINYMQKKILQAAAQLEVNTTLMGHTPWSPTDALSDYAEIDATEDQLDRFADYATDKQGQFGLSDYGLPKVQKILVDLLQTPSPERKLVLIDRILNVLHMRGDMAEFFVEGGSKTLDELAGSGEDSPLKSVPPDLSIDQDTFDALVQLGAAHLIDELPKGLTLAGFNKWLDRTTAGGLSMREKSLVHAMAYEMTRPEGHTLAAEAKASLRNRLAHARRAQSVLMNEGLTEITPEGIAEYKERRAGVRAAAKEKVKAGEAYRDDRHARTILDVAEAAGASEPDVLMAFSLRETPNARTLRDIYDRAVRPPDRQEWLDANPGKTAADFKAEFADRPSFEQALAGGHRLLAATKDELTRQKWEQKAGAGATEKQINDLQNAVKVQATDARLAQKALQQHFKDLEKGPAGQTLSMASNGWNLSRSIMFGGDLGFIGAQGQPLMLMYPSAWAKAMAHGIPPAMEIPNLNKALQYVGILGKDEGVGQFMRKIPGLDAQLKRLGITGDRFEQAITEFYNSEMRKRLETGGVKFERIGNIADFNDDFMSDIAAHIFWVAQTNKAHSLTTDLFRYYGGERILSELDKMYEDGKISAFDYNRSKEFFTKKFINVMSGKGYMGFADALAKPLAQGFSAPRYAISAFQLPYYANPIRAAFLPKGARKIMMKNSAKLWGAAALAFGLLSMLGLVNDDPEDKDFLQIDFDRLIGKHPGLAQYLTGTNDLKVNPIRSLKEPLRLGMALPLKMMYYAATGNRDGLNRIGKEYYSSFVMDPFGSLGSFWKAKLHPSASDIIQIYNGKNYVGEPLQWTDIAPLPLPAKEVYQAWTYDHKQNVLKSGADSGQIKDNWNRVMYTALAGMLGYGANSYASTESTAGMKELQSLMGHDDRPEDEKLTSQRANQLERLIREGVDVSEEINAFLATNKITQKQADQLVKTLTDDLGDVEKRFGVKFTDEEKLKLSNNRRALKVLDYLYADKGAIDWKKIDKALPFMSPNENWLNDRAAEAEAEAIVLQTVLRSPRLTGSGVGTDDVVNLIEGRAAKLSDEERARLVEVLKKKAENANKGGTLTKDEVRNIQRVIPDFQISLKPPKAPKKLADLAYAKDGGLDDNSAEIRQANAENEALKAAPRKPISDTMMKSRQSRNVLNYQKGTEAGGLYNALTEDMSDDEFERVVRATKFSRISPTEKADLLKVVRDGLSDLPIGDDHNAPVYRLWKELERNLAGRVPAQKRGH